jgi:hypothetical protein
MFRSACVSAGLLLSLCLTRTCEAGAVFTLGNNPQPNEQNVLFGTSETGSTVTGFTNSSNLAVLFSSTQTLFQQSKGQADVGAISPSTNAAIAVTNITLTAPKGTNDVILNPHIGGQPKIDTSTPATVTVVTAEPGGGTQSFTFTYPSSGAGAWGNGNNFLTITTTGGETIVSVTVDAPGGFDDLQQPRVSGSFGVVGPFVPEPASLTLAGICAGWLVWQVRRNRRKSTSHLPNSRGCPSPAPAS